MDDLVGMRDVEGIGRTTSIWGHQTGQGRRWQGETGVLMAMPNGKRATHPWPGIVETGHLRHGPDQHGPSGAICVKAATALT